MEPKDKWKNLLSLRAIMNTAGALHEVQIHNLRMWGALAFGLSAWELSIDLQNKSINYKIIKYLVSDHAKNLENALRMSIKDMLGEEWTVNVERFKRVTKSNRSRKDRENTRKVNSKGAKGV